MKANVYTVDGVSGKVAAFTDCVPDGTGIRAAYPTHAYSQALSANQVALPAAVAGLGNRLAAPFAGGQFYASTAPASAWKAPHDGTGFTAVMVLSRTTVTGVQFSWSTFGPTGETGAGALINGSTTYFQVYNAAVNTLLAGIAGETTGPTFNVTTLAQADNPDSTLYRRTVSGGAATASSGFSSADPAGTMVLGSNRSGSGQYLNAQVAECIFFTRSLSAQDRAAVNAYVASEYGLT